MTKLLLIQIDGLSRRELEDACAAGRMPFLGSLPTRAEYRLHTLYSGLPSSTPAVQAELFYGVRGAVPAFGFRDPKTGELVTMLDRHAAARAEESIARDGGEPLLAGGSAYCDIFVGGAAESHFCSATLSAAAFLPAGGQLALVRYIVAHARGLAVAVVFAALELVRALVDCACGILAGQTALQELKFVPARLAMCVILRELCAAGVRLDMARSLPVIHVNLPGYDEQAHRRGPGTAFARAALGGIDRTIRRLFRSAHARGYSVWIYSDHGQEATQPFAQATGRSLAQALGAALPAKLDHQVIAKGPVGHVYAPGITTAERDAAARSLVALGVPLVLAAAPDAKAHAWTARGTFTLPIAAADVLGPEHQLLEPVARDLVRLCHNASAGDLVISGYASQGPQLTFPDENGSHAGPGPEETRAFALLPTDTPLADPAAPHLRPLDLRHAALAQVGRP